MTITIDDELAARLQERAQMEGLTESAYVERLVKAERSAELELEALALERLESGDPVVIPGPGYWEEKHRRLSSEQIA